MVGRQGTTIAALQGEASEKSGSMEKVMLMTIFYCLSGAVIEMGAHIDADQDQVLILLYPMSTATWTIVFTQQIQ